MTCSWKPRAHRREADGANPRDQLPGFSGRGRVVDPSNHSGFGNFHKGRRTRQKRPKRREKTDFACGASRRRSFSIAAHRRAA